MHHKPYKLVCVIGRDPRSSDLVYADEAQTAKLAGCDSIVIIGPTAIAQAAADAANDQVARQRDERFPWFEIEEL